MRTNDRPAVDVVDSTWLAAPPAAVADVLAEAANWRRWWPGLELRVQELRGAVGVRWWVDSVAAAVTGGGAALAGSAEVWLEATCGGTVAHFFLRLDASPGATDGPDRGAAPARPLPRHTAARVSEHYRRCTKQAFWALGDRLDPGRSTRLTSVPDVRSS